MSSLTVAELREAIQSLALDDNAKVGISVGKTEDGKYQFVAVDSDGRYVPREIFSTDAFGRVRVSNPFCLFHSKQIADNQALWWDDAETAGGGTSSTFLTNKASVELAVALNTVGTRVRQTKQWFNYQPGKSQLIEMTGVLGTGVAGITRRIGQFETSNGLFFQLSGTTLSVVRRSKTSGVVVDSVINQADWNLDKLDGTGESGATLDPSQMQIFNIDYQWLGIGRIRFGFHLNGEVVYCHQILLANTINTPYMSTPNLPVRWEISNDGTGPAATLVHACTSVMSEGGVERTGFSLSVDRGVTALTTQNDADLYPLVATRLKDTHLGASIVTEYLSIMAPTANDLRWALLLNPTVVGDAFSFSDVANSALQVDVARTNTTKVSGGTTIASGYIAGGTGSAGSSILVPRNRGIQLGSKIDGTRDVLVLAVQRLTGAAVAIYGGISWEETE